LLTKSPSGGSSWKKELVALVPCAPRCADQQCCKAILASSYLGSAGASEVPDTQAAAGTSSYFAIFFTFSLASAILYVAVT
jgi:hypothetical protein